MQVDNDLGKIGLNNEEVKAASLKQHY